MNLDRFSPFPWSFPDCEPGCAEIAQRKRRVQLLSYLYKSKRVTDCEQASKT